MKTTIHGHTVEYDNEVSNGIRYLRYELNSDEVKVFFDAAFSHGSAEFEDHAGTRFSLIHHGGEYKLEKA